MFGSNAVVGNNIPALARNGEYIHRPFMGALNDVALLHVQKVKLVNITAYTYDESGVSEWHEVPRDHYILGIYKDRGYYILTRNNVPITYPLTL